MLQALSLAPKTWKEISSLPVKESALASCGGHLLAIGGEDDSENSTSAVYRYDSHANSWSVVSRMKYRGCQCLAVTLPGDSLVVVEGYTVEISF
jgi:N-acetylneuraminic acid mutarotase